ncbi:hypothetical protein ABL78_4089 [Leptomonas seymouri]|uniref:Uncharacterized protein n=1 Tax=Leptomonas seymouri TaxID=5684 RepID=A0A0N1IKJ7_LEPSE|nr:hypothetical protein ABL78_4089 [Leptomonas seymouri]|eukprot:KPI86853.1 hypothetical protein ABL78_4089 [Leptomonas seymouri]
MIADLFSQSAACEDQSTAWLSHQANYTSNTTGIHPSSFTESRLSSSSRSSGSISKHSPVVQEQMQNSINGDVSFKKSSTRSACLTRRWSEDVNAQNSVSLNSLPWSGAEAPQTTGCKSTLPHGHGSSCRSDKPAKGLKKALKNTPLPSTISFSSAAKREESLYKHTADWDGQSTGLLGSTGDGEVRGVALKSSKRSKRTVGSVKGAASASDEDHGDGSHISSRALFATRGRQQSSNSLTLPMPCEGMSVQAAMTCESTTVVRASTNALQCAVPESSTGNCSGAAATGAAAAAVTSSFSGPSASCTGYPTAPTVSRTPSSSFTMTDIATALRSTPEGQHPFLDMDYQRRVREYKRVQERLNEQVVQSFQNQFSSYQQAIAIKCLLNAAHRHQYRQCMDHNMTEEESKRRESEGFAGARAPSRTGRWSSRECRLVNLQWALTAKQAESDLYREGITAVQRKLSSMCLFNPDSDVRVYGDNCSMREQRCYRQHRLLVCLQHQRMRGGNPYFLEEPQKHKGS